jgi:hypothetical protein
MVAAMARLRLLRFKIGSKRLNTAVLLISHSRIFEIDTTEYSNDH